MLSLWKFYFVKNCKHTKPNPKPKRIVIVCRENDNYYGFLVNSEIRRFVQNRPGLFACQVLIKQSDYPTILDHDSYIDCTQIYPFSEIELENTSFLKTATKDNIKKVITQATLLD